MQKQKLPLFLLILLLGFPQISETIYTPSLPDIAYSLATTDSLVEFTLSIYFLGFAVGVGLWGLSSDYIGRRPSMLLGLLTYSIGNIGCYTSRSIEWLLFWRFVQALGASAGSVVTQTMIRDCYTGVRRHQLFSILGGALALSPAIGPLIGGYVDQWIGWRGNFTVLIVMGMALGVYSYLRLPETRPLHSVKSTDSIMTIWKKLCFDPKVLTHMMLIAGCNGIIFSYYAEAPFIAIDLLGYMPGQYGLMGGLICMMGLLASYLSHRWNKTFQPESIIIVGCLLTLIGAGSLSFLAGQGMIEHGMGIARLVICASALGCLFLGINLIIPNSLSKALTDYQAALGTAGALFGLMYYSIISFLTFLMGLLNNGTVMAMPLYFLGLSVLILLNAYFGLGKRLIKQAYHI